MYDELCEDKKVVDNCSSSVVIISFVILALSLSQWCSVVVSHLIYLSLAWQVTMLVSDIQASHGSGSGVQATTDLSLSCQRLNWLLQKWLNAL